MSCSYKIKRLQRENDPESFCEAANAMSDSEELHGMRPSLALDAASPSCRSRSQSDGERDREKERERGRARVWKPQEQPQPIALRSALQPPFAVPTGLAAGTLPTQLPALFSQLAEAHAHEATGEAAAALRLQQPPQPPMALHDALAIVKRLLGV